MSESATAAEKKKAGVGMCCRKCGQPLYVWRTAPQGRNAVSRRRWCKACGTRYRTAEVIVEEVAAAA